MEMDEPMETDAGDFFGQPENTVQSDLDAPVPPADLNSMPENPLQPRSTFNLERGFRKEPGHPKFPWFRIVEQRADNYVHAVLGRWNSCEELPTQNLARLPFAFPWDIKEIKTAVEDPQKLAEWNDIISQSFCLPMCIYTPTLFAMLMAAPENKPVQERNWLSPVMLSTSAMRAYMQIIFFLSNNKSLVPIPRRKDILRSAGAMFRQRGELVTRLIMQDPKYVELVRCWSMSEALDNQEFNERFVQLAEIVAGHTHIYIEILETTILRLCDMDPHATIALRALFCESAVPDPEAERIRPFADQQLESWHTQNTLYINRLFQLRNRALPIEWGKLRLDNVRGVSKEALWCLVKLMVSEVPE